MSLLLRTAAEPFLLSLPEMQFVLPMQHLNVLFFKLVTSRGMLHSDFKPKLVVFDKTFHFNPVTLPYSYKGQDFAALFFSGKMMMEERLMCFC